MAATVTPNYYDLQGPGIVIGYSTSGIDGKPELSLKKGRQTQTFSGEEINTLESTIGTVVSVTIASTVDRESKLFSFLLPSINLATAAGRQAFRTIGITTLKKTTIAGPVKGPQQTYKSVNLRGNARQVTTIAQKTATV